MPSTYSPNLRIELIASGEQGNTWGGTTNNNLGTLIENAISGTVSIDSMPSNTYTLTVLNGANDNARNMYIKVSSSTTLTAAGTIIAPAVSKMYVVTNNSIGGSGFPITLKTSASPGISIPNGATRTVFYDGTDFVDTVTATKSLLLNADATQNLQATTLQQVTTGLATKISRDGSLAMTGLLTLSTSTLSPSAAATTATPKGYVDLFVPLAGNAVAMTGPLILYSTDPVGYQATSKNYNDSFYLAKTGGTLTGAVTMTAGALTLYSTLPTTAWQAVPKQYVDNITVNYGPGISITGTIAANNVAVNLLYATTSTIGGVKVDGTSITINGSGVISAATGGGGTVQNFVFTNGNGFTGSVTTSTTTPTLALTTNVTGVLYGNGTSMAAATSGQIAGVLGSTAYYPYSSNPAGYLTSVPSGTATQTYVQNYSVYKGGDTMTGALTLSVSGTFPTLQTYQSSTYSGRYATIGYGQNTAFSVYGCVFNTVSPSFGGGSGSFDVWAVSQQNASYGSPIPRFSIGTGGSTNVYGNLNVFADTTTGTQAGNLVVAGTITAGTKPFRIPHPVVADKDLVHIAVESPRADMLYRGVVKLTDGYATVEIDANSNMTDGTFAAFTQNVEVVALRNKDGFTRVKAGEVVQGTFHITAEDATCTDNIAWMVVAERADPFMKELNLTDINGRLMPEQDKLPVVDPILGA